MQTVAVCNQKGGVCKTTTVAAVSSSVAARGARVLCVDLDPQGNLTDVLGETTYDRDTVYEVLMGNADIAETIVHREGADLLPAEITLASAEKELLGVLNGPARLKKALAKVADNYDLCVIDCSPSLGLLVTMALTAADYVVIPTTSSFLATKGITQLAQTIADVREFTNPGLQVAGILLTKYHRQTNNAKVSIVEAETMASALNCKLFSTKIREAVKVEEAHASGKPIVEFAPTSAPARDYESFVDELLIDMGWTSE